MSTRQTAQGAFAIDNLPAVLPEAAYPPAVVERLAEYAERARGAYAENTEKAIKSDTAVFAEWCRGRGYSSLPALPEAVAAFVDAMSATRAVATLRRYVSSIAHMHKAAGVADPTKDDGGIVRLAMKRVARERGTRQRQASPLNRNTIDRILSALGSRPRDLRDAALLCVAYDTLCRRSELAAFDIDHLTFGDDGCGTALVARSKTDQEGAGMVRFLAADTVTRVRAWLAQLGAASGPLFRSLSKSGKPGERLSADDVARIYRRAALLAGVAVEGISGHSTRVGGAQDLTAAGFGLAEVMQAGGWKSPSMPARYGEHLQARRGAMAKLAALQNRT